MTMGDLIKNSRIRLELSQEAFGDKLDPPVKKAAINKWENGTVENIKRTHIKQMANMFGLSPSELMCWEDSTIKKQPSFHTINHLEDERVRELVELFYQLNDSGKEKAIENVSDLAEIPKYTEVKKGIEEMA